MSPVSNSSEQQPFTYAPGDVIAGKYELDELIGSGGMGAVFRARNTAIDMPVALKLIRTDLDRELLRGRLLQEARAAAKLAHPAIVRVFDVGTTDLGDPFIVMELLQGLSLAKLLEREGRLSSARAVQLLLPIADALAVAHARGFVHRDVKPDNVFIVNDEEGQLQPKLVDFGIVKLEVQNGDSHLTQVGAVLGSPDYMSPEQARGLDTIDHRSDIWSFSVVLYEAICGVPPFQSSSYNALLRLIAEAEPLSLVDRCAADQALSDILARGLSKNPDARPASIAQLGKELAGWLAEQGINEDACGVSVEVRWLSRPTDPTSPGRASLSSAPDSWPAPTSGVRSRRLGDSPTVPLAEPTGTPYSMGHTAQRRPHHDWRWYAVAAVIAGAALALGWLAARGAPALTVPTGRATTVAAPVEPATPAPTTEALAVTPPAPVPSSRPLAAAAKRSAPQRSPKAAALPQPHSPTPSKAMTAPPKSDLISPY